VTCETHDLSATRSIIPSVLAGYARQADIVGTQWGFGDQITAWTADPPPSASSHLLLEIEKQWRDVKRRSIEAYKELEHWQRKCERARAPKAKQRALDMYRSQANEYARLCKECDALDAHAEYVHQVAAQCAEKAGAL